MLKFEVPDMSCGHCVQAITNAVKAVDASANVKADLETRSVAVETRTEPAEIAAALESAGYPPQAA